MSEHTATVELEIARPDGDDLSPDLDVRQVSAIAYQAADRAAEEHLVQSATVTRIERVETDENEDEL